MVTTKENSSLPAGANFQDAMKVNDPGKDGGSSWAAQVEKMEGSVSDRFFTIKRMNGGSFEKVSPFLIHKTLISVVGDVKEVKKIRSGDLLVEVRDDKQASKILKMTCIGEFNVIVLVHANLNSSRGVISEYDLIDISEAEILENLRDQKVIGVRRINIRRDNAMVKTRNLILTFGTPTLPEVIYAGYLRCSVRPFIANPLRCFKCQRFGHSKLTCRGQLTCARCATVGHESEGCNKAVCCVNCKKDHPAYSRMCEKWILEKEIQAVRTKQKLPYPEARKLVLARTPKSGVSYATTVSKSVSMGTQTTITPCTFSQSHVTCEMPASSSKGTEQPRKKVSDFSMKAPQALNTTQTSVTVSPIHKQVKSTTSPVLSPAKSSQANPVISYSEESAAAAVAAPTKNMPLPSHQTKCIENATCSSEAHTQNINSKTSRIIKTKVAPVSTADKLMKRKQDKLSKVATVKSSTQTTSGKKLKPQCKKPVLNKTHFLKDSLQVEEPTLSLHASDEDAMSTLSEEGEDTS